MKHPRVVHTIPQVVDMLTQNKTTDLKLKQLKKHNYKNVESIATVRLNYMTLHKSVYKLKVLNNTLRKRVLEHVYV